MPRTICISTQVGWNPGSTFNWVSAISIRNINSVKPLQNSKSRMQFAGRRKFSPPKCKVVVCVIHLYLYIYYLVNKPIFIFSVSIASPPQLAGASFGGTAEEIGGTGGNGGFNFPNILLVLKTKFFLFSFIYSN